MLDGFAVTYPIEVRWGDMDALGHVNNAVYFRYFESARIAWFERVGLRDASGQVSAILAHVRCDFLRPVTYPARLLCGIRLSKLGHTSLGHEYLLVDAADPAAPPFARGESVVVAYDYAAGTKVPIPPALREAIAALERGGSAHG